LNEAIENMASLFQINHWKTTPYHPQTNGQTECVNQTLVRILRKTVHDFKKDWDSKLTATLWPIGPPIKLSLVPHLFLWSMALRPSSYRV
jgi:hypothetical protein